MWNILIFFSNQEIISTAKCLLQTFVSEYRLALKLWCHLICHGCCFISGFEANHGVPGFSIKTWCSISCLWYTYYIRHVNIGSMSSALAMGILQSCTKPPISCYVSIGIDVMVICILKRHQWWMFGELKWNMHLVSLSCQCYGWYNRLVSQMRATLAACRESAGKLWQLYKVFYVFEHKAQYILIHAPITRIVVFWHIGNVPPMIP